MKRLELIYRAEIKCTGEILEVEYTSSGLRTLYHAVLSRLKDVQRDKMFYDIQSVVISGGMLVSDESGSTFVYGKSVCAISVSVICHEMRTYIERV